MVTHFKPTMRFNFSTSRTPSTIRQGQRGGKYFWISTTSISIRALRGGVLSAASPPIRQNYHYTGGRNTHGAKIVGGWAGRSAPAVTGHATIFSSISVFVLSVGLIHPTPSTVT